MVLAHYEEAISRAFDRVEYIVENLRKGGRGVRDRLLLGEIGEVLATQARMMGRVEVVEKPESAWDSPELDRLYEKLAVEYELRDRDLALTRKLEVVAETAHTQLELLSPHAAGGVVHRTAYRVRYRSVTGRKILLNDQVPVFTQYAAVAGTAGQAFRNRRA